MDRLTAARVFVEVVERGSQTAAAEHLEMSRAMISRYLGELESWVGARLLHRTTRRLSLTGMGAELLPRCRDMLALADTPEESLKIWQALPGFHWNYPVAKLRPAATSLVVNPRAKMGEQAMAIVATQWYGKGQVIYLGTDETWRWRFNVQDKHFIRFWGQLIYQAGLPSLLGQGAQRVQAALERSQAVLGQPGSVFVRLLDKDFNPRRDAQVSTERILTFSMPESWTAAAFSSSISSLTSRRTLPDSGSMIRSSETRPMMRSRSGSMISPDSTMARASMPSSVPQSRSDTITSCATSTRRRVR